MDTIENQLKALIKERYGSVNEFCKEIKIPYGTLGSMLDKGITNIRINNVIKICSALQIDINGLTEGKIVPLKTETSSPDIEERILTMLNWIRSTDQIVFRGKPADLEVIRYIETSLEMGIGLARKHYYES